MSSWQLWLIVGIGLLVSEMVAPGFWLINVAAGCFASAAVALVVPWLGLGLQTATFAAVTLASAVLIRPILLRHFHRGDVRTNVDALIGKTAVVIQRIDPAGRTGRVLVDGEDWRGAAIDDTTLRVDRETLP